MSLFSSLHLSEPVMRGVQSMGYTEPTPIQAQAIPLILEGRDLIGASQTGTGKTAAFVLPILTKLADGNGSRCLILEPTRELAHQVHLNIADLGTHTNITTSIIHGGVGFASQIESLKNGADIIIATPGRLLDLMSRGQAKLDKIQFLVLDETDRMLDMGFLPDVRKIVNQCPEKRQTMLFSATMPAEIKGLAQWALKDPAEIEIGARRTPAETVTHAFYPIADNQKDELLLAILSRTDFDAVMIFTRTKRDADRIYDLVKRQTDHAVAVMHADLNQSQRTSALQGFREGKFSIIVATDIAARGLDIGSVTHVINYSVPENAEDYVHRIGRTGRAQKEGDAFTILTAVELPYANAIESYVGQKINRRKLENFDYTYTALLDSDSGNSRDRLQKMLSRRPKPKRRR